MMVQINTKHSTSVAAGCAYFKANNKADHIIGNHMKPMPCTKKVVMRHVATRASIATLAYPLPLHVASNLWCLMPVHT